VNDKAAEDCLSFNGTYVLPKNECPVKASPAGAKIVRKFSEKGNRLNDRALVSPSQPNGRLHA